MAFGHQHSTTTMTEANSKKETQKYKKQKKNEEKEFYDDDIEEAFEVECILKENQSHYKVRWLGYDMTHDSWVTKEEIEENAPEVLAIYRNTLANAAKCVLLSKTMMTLVVQQHADLNTELYQHAHKHLQ